MLLEKVVRHLESRISLRTLEVNGRLGTYYASLAQA